MTKLKRPKPLRVRFKKHRTPESVLRAYVAPMRVKLEDITFGIGFMRDGSSAPEHEALDMVAAIREQGLWGFAATKARPPLIHYWTDGKRSPEELAAFLGHELGHCTGSPLHDVEEEWRADSYGEVARLVWRELRKR